MSPMDDQRLKEGLRAVHKERATPRDLAAVHEEVISTPIEDVPQQLGWLRRVTAGFFVQTYGAMRLVAAGVIVGLLGGFVLSGFLTQPDADPVAGPVEGRLVVALDGPADFRTIAEAVAAATEGEVVLVRPGSYEESVSITKDIEIRGDGPSVSDVVVRVRDGTHGFRLRGSDAIVSHLTFESIEPGARHAVIDVIGGSPTLHHLASHSAVGTRFDFVHVSGTEPGTLLRDSVASGMVRAGGRADMLIADNVLRRTDPDARAAGIVAIGGGTHVRVVGNDVNYIDVRKGASAEIEANDVSGAHRADPDSDVTPSYAEGRCGIRILGSPTTHLIDNVIHGNETGVCGGEQIRGGRIADNVVGIWIGAQGHTRVDAVEVSGNRVGMQFVTFTTGELQDVILCDNGVDIQAHETAVIDEVGTSGCG